MHLLLDSEAWNLCPLSTVQMVTGEQNSKATVREKPLEKQRYLQLAV